MNVSLTGYFPTYFPAPLLVLSGKPTQVHASGYSHQTRNVQNMPRQYASLLTSWFLTPSHVELILKLIEILASELQLLKLMKRSLTGFEPVTPGY